MEISTQKTDDTCIVTVKGEVDASSSIRLDATLQEIIGQQYKKILVNFQFLTYISSAGIGVFTSRLEDCQHNHIKLVLFGMNHDIFNVFKILGLDQLLTIVSTEEEAKRIVHDEI